MTTQDFTVYEIPGYGWHWEGQGSYSEFCSEDGFETEQAAIDDATTFLSTVAI